MARRGTGRCNGVERMVEFLELVMEETVGQFGGGLVASSTNGDSLEQRSE
jgi:hypothetical protein